MLGAEQMSATPHEQEFAQTNGVKIKHWAKPARLIGEGGAGKRLTVARRAVAEAIAQQVGDEDRLARAYSYLINYHYLLGETARTIDYGARCLAIAARRGDAALATLARRYLGHSHHAQGQHRRAQLAPRRRLDASIDVAVLTEQVGGPRASRRASGAGPAATTVAAYAATSTAAEIDLRELSQWRTTNLARGKESMPGAARATRKRLLSERPLPAHW